MKDPRLNTDLQNRFLEALAGEAKGDLHKAKAIAGYAPETSLRNIIEPLKDQIIEIAKDIMAATAIKAVMQLNQVLDTPAMMGASNIVNAAKEIMDRSGISKSEGQQLQLPQGAIVLLPPKRPKTIEYIENEE